MSGSSTESGENGEESDGPAITSPRADFGLPAAMPSTTEETVDTGRPGDENAGQMAANVDSAGSVHEGGHSETTLPPSTPLEGLDARFSSTVSAGGEEAITPVVLPHPVASPVPVPVSAPDPDGRGTVLVDDRVYIILDSPERGSPRNSGAGEQPNDDAGVAPRSSAQPAETSDAARKRPRLHETVEHAETRSSEETSDTTEPDNIACPICMEPWTNSGDHRVCCLTCGHLFGKSCIVRWLRQEGRRQAKCPQCNKRARVEDVRPLYVARVAVADNQGQQLAQEVRGLKSENYWLRSENARLLKQVQVNQEMISQIQSSTRRSFLNGPIQYDYFGGDGLNSTTLPAVGGEGYPLRTCLNAGHGQTLGARHNVGPDDSYKRSHRAGFILKNQMKVHGGRVFDMDADSQTVLFSNKVPGCGSRFRLSKLSLLDVTEMEDIDLPQEFGAIRDIRLSPSGIGGPGKLALVAMGGKKLCVMSPISNNLVLTYSVQSPPWSCTWDPYSPHLVYSGLQNGSLLEFDLRQTSSPVAELCGASARPIHTLQVVAGHHNVQHRPGLREILGASNTGLFRWSGCSLAESDRALPQWIFSSKQKVCVSLAYERSTSTAVASFRQSPLAQCDASTSGTPAPSSSPPLEGPEMCRVSPAVIDRDEPSHWIFNRGLSEDSNPRSQVNHMSGPIEANPGWRWVGAMAGHKSQSSLMPRGAIISMSDSSSSEAHALFAGGDERSNKVWLWDMETLRLVNVLEPAHQSPVLDVKCAQVRGMDLMCSMSDATFHVYRRVSS